MAKKISFTVKVRRPVCRTPIKPVQAHKNEAKYSRKLKHPLRKDKND
jgi:hypothetical protein